MTSDEHHAIQEDLIVMALRGLLGAEEYLRASHLCDTLYLDPKNERDLP